MNMILRFEILFTGDLLSTGAFVKIVAHPFHILIKEDVLKQLFENIDVATESMMEQLSLMSFTRWDFLAEMPWLENLVGRYLAIYRGFIDFMICW